MVAIRGTVDDYERWADEYGCDGWGWRELLEAFLGLEDDADYGGDGLHGRGGPIPLWRTPGGLLAPLRPRVAGGDHRARLPDRRRLPRQRSDRHEPDRVDDARRQPCLDERTCTSSRLGSWPNLAVRGDVLVDRVLLEGRRAAGVRRATGEAIEARDVIVSGGAIHSPAILLRSGIGAADGLPVGANLKDHAETPGFELGLARKARMTSAEAPVLTSMLRYTSGLADAGPNDMQISWSPRSGRLTMAWPVGG